MSSILATAPDSGSLRQKLMFIVAGAAGAAFEIGIFKLLHLAGLNAMLASTLATTCAVVLNYLLSIRFVFQRGRFRPHAEIMAFLLVSVLVIGLNQAVFWCLLQLFGTWPIFAKAGAILFVATFSYLAKRRYVFRG